MELQEYVVMLAERAKEAASALRKLSSEVKNRALIAMAEALKARSEEILEANQKDVAAGKEKGLSTALIDRLTLNEKRINAMSEGLCEVAALPDPVGEVMRMWRRPNGLRIGKIRVPIGVIGIIYEARPNVTADAAGLCLKSGNAVILRGGSEAINSNTVIAKILQEAAAGEGVPEGAIQLVESTDRQAVNIMLSLDQYIDLIIPRGGKGLIETVVSNSRIPVIKHYAGVCHVYVDKDANMDMAEEITFNAKVQRPGVCNAMETLLVAEDIAEEFLPVIAQRLKTAGVELRGCPATRKILPDILEASEEDWYTEYLDLILSIKIVKNVEEAIEHINKYGTHHSDAIVTENYATAMKFLEEVDSAAVYVNASTRFTDGYEFGMGAEIGISTDKLHARGPMGLEELTTYKFIVFGSGQIRE